MIFFLIHILHVVKGSDLPRYVKVSELEELLKYFGEEENPQITSEQQMADEKEFTDMRIDFTDQKTECQASNDNSNDCISSIKNNLIQSSSTRSQNFEIFNNDFNKCVSGINIDPLNSQLNLTINNVRFIPYEASNNTFEDDEVFNDDFFLNNSMSNSSDNEVDRNLEIQLQILNESISKFYKIPPITEMIYDSEFDEFLFTEFAIICKRLISFVLYNSSELKEILAPIIKLRQENPVQIDNLILNLFEFAQTIKISGMIDIFEKNLETEWSSLNELLARYKKYLNSRGINYSVNLILDLKELVFNTHELFKKDKPEFKQILDSTIFKTFSSLYMCIYQCDEVKRMYMLTLGYVIHDITAYFYFNLRNVLKNPLACFETQEKLFTWIFNSFLDLISSPILDLLDDNIEPVPSANLSIIRDLEGFIYSIFLILKAKKSGHVFDYNLFSYSGEILTWSSNNQIKDFTNHTWKSAAEELENCFYNFIRQLKKRRDSLKNFDPKSLIIQQNVFVERLVQIEPEIDLFFKDLFILINSII